MKKHKLTLLWISAAVLIASCGKSVNTKKKPKTMLDSFSYAYGMMLGKQMRSQGLKELDYSSFLRGYEEAINKDSGYAIPLTRLQNILMSYSQKEGEKFVKAMQKENREFMQAKRKEGYTVLPSGGLLKINKKGNGKTSGDFDTIVYVLVMKDKKGAVLQDGTKLPPQRASVYNLRAGFSDFFDALQQTPAGSDFNLVVENEKVPSISREAQSLEDKNNVTIFQIKLLDVIPGKAPKEDPNKNKNQQLSPEMMQQLQEQLQNQGR